MRYCSRRLSVIRFSEGLHPHLQQPLADGEIVHVHVELQRLIERQYACSAIVRRCGEVIITCGLLRSQVGRKRPIHVGFGEVIRSRIELRQFRARPAQGIEIGHQVAANAKSADQLVDAILQDGEIVGGARVDGRVAKIGGADNGRDCGCPRLRDRECERIGDGGRLFAVAARRQGRGEKAARPELRP